MVILKNTSNNNNNYYNSSECELYTLCVKTNEKRKSMSK